MTIVPYEAKDSKLQTLVTQFFGFVQAEVSIRTALLSPRRGVQDDMVVKALSYLDKIELLEDEERLDLLQRSTKALRSYTTGLSRSRNLARALDSLVAARKSSRRMMDARGEEVGEVVPPLSLFTNAQDTPKAQEALDKAKQLLEEHGSIETVDQVRAPGGQDDENDD